MERKGGTMIKGEQSRGDAEPVSTLRVAEVNS